MPTYVADPALGFVQHRPTVEKPVPPVLAKIAGAG